MKKVLRSKVFETNSSSSHTVTIYGDLGVPVKDKNCFPIDDITGKIHVHLDECEYGWGYERFKDPWNKLKYAIMMVIETEANKCKSIEEIYQLEGFKTIQNVIPNDILIIDDYLHFDDYLFHSGYIYPLSKKVHL